MPNEKKPFDQLTRNRPLTQLHVPHKLQVPAGRRTAPPLFVPVQQLLQNRITLVITQCEDGAKSRQRMSLGVTGNDTHPLGKL